jgi:hypothetical protein
VLWVVFAWVVAAGLAVILVLSAGLGVWRSVKTLTSALGDVGAHAAAAAEELSSVAGAVGAGENGPDATSGREPARGPGRTMKARRRPPVGRGR